MCAGDLASVQKRDERCLWVVGSSVNKLEYTFLLSPSNYAFSHFISDFHIYEEKLSVILYHGIGIL